jgi:hypothetical protein
MRLAPTATLLGSALLAVLLPRSARAVGPLETEFSAKVGYGTNLSGGPADLLGLGVGGTGGLTLFGFYAGVDILRYFGSSATIDGTTDSASAWMGGIDLGYAFRFATVTIRPQLGTGDLWVNSGFSRPPCMFCEIEYATHGSSSAHNLYFEPGVTALLALGEFAFVGVDANLFTLPHIVDESGDKPQTSFTFHAQVGAHF